MADRREDNHCLLCHNRCDVTMTVNDVGIVTAAWRNIPAHNGSKQKSCRNLNETIGKNLDNAVKLIHRPSMPRHIAGGH